MFNKKYKDMEKKYRLIPFDVEKAKNGAEVVTAKENLNVEILRYDLQCDSPILAIVNYGNGSQRVCLYRTNGTIFNQDLDLRIKEEVEEGEDNRRRMTNQELSWWLREHSEEHREWRWTSAVYVNTSFSYLEKEANEECEEDILIRSNGGGWREPLIEIEEE